MSRHPDDPWYMYTICKISENNLLIMNISAIHRYTKSMCIYTFSFPNFSSICVRFLAVSQRWRALFLESCPRSSAWDILISSYLLSSSSLSVSATKRDSSSFFSWDCSPLISLWASTSQSSKGTNLAIWICCQWWIKITWKKSTWRQSMRHINWQYFQLVLSYKLILPLS